MNSYLFPVTGYFSSIFSLTGNRKPATGNYLCSFINFKRLMIESVKSVIHNFNAGPSVLPKEVFEEASRAVIDFNETGLSILEIGHRTSLFEPVMAEARVLTKE